ncbi:hypothetical protein EAG_14384, partial [Camponotus floridanus]
PDPYVVTFKNLHSTVVALADEQVEASARQYFRENCAIPGTTWNANKLLNGPTIIPTSYGVGDLAFDQRCFRGFLATISGKCPHLVGECTFSGRGSPAQLVTCFKEPFK